MKKGKRRTKRKNRKKRFFTFIELIFIAIMLFSSYKIYEWYSDNSSNSVLLDRISNSITINNDNIDVDFDTLKKINNDTVAYLRIEGTDIEYPVVRHTDNDFYLNHNFRKKQNGAGWIFADYRCKVDGFDKNLVIYGHNRKDGSMFGSLKNVVSSKDIKYITLVTEKENIRYQIFSIYQIEQTDNYIQTEFNSHSFREFVNKVKKRSLKDYEVEVNEDDNLITLSTCANDSRFRIVVHAKRIEQSA